MDLILIIIILLLIFGSGFGYNRWGYGGGIGIGGILLIVLIVYLLVGQGILIYSALSALFAGRRWIQPRPIADDAGPSFRTEPRQAGDFRPGAGRG
jgi:hypothetical protein